MLPQAVPLQPGPETLQLTAGSGLEFGAGVSVAVNCATVPVSTEAGPLTARLKLLVTLIVAVTAFEGSARLLAVSVMLGSGGRICGAANSPLMSMLPQAVPLQPAPERVQLTARFGLPELLTVAANCRVAPSSTSAVTGVTAIARSLRTATVALAILVGSAWLVAWT